MKIFTEQIALKLLLKIAGKEGKPFDRPKLHDENKACLKQTSVVLENYILEVDRLSDLKLIIWK